MRVYTVQRLEAYKQMRKLGYLECISSKKI